MGPDEQCPYLPRSEWRKPSILIEPETNGRYSRFNVGHYAIPPMDKIITMDREFTPPVKFQEFNGEDPRLDKFFLDVWGDNYLYTKRNFSEDPFPIEASIFMALSMCRKARLGNIDRMSVLLWVNWARIEPSWFLMGARQNYWLLSEEELGIKHGKKIGADA